MTTITTRSGKGSPLTNDEVDANFSGLNNDKVETSGDSMTGNLSFGDNNKAIFGAGSDLSIFHNGTTSVIEDSGTGNLQLRTSTLAVVNAAGTEVILQGVEDGAVSLYHNAGAKLATTATGIDVTGVITTDGMTTSADINVADNVSIRFGDATNGDLVIKHDGTNSSIVDRGDGDLLIQGSTNVKLQNFTGSKDYFVGSNGGASTVYHDGSARLATTSTGIDVTGSITTDGLTSVGGFISIGADGAGDDFRFYGDTSGRYMEWVSSVDSLLFRDGAKALFGNGSDLQIYHDGSNSYVKENGTGNLWVTSNGTSVGFGNNDLSELYAVFNNDGEAKLFFNGVQKFATSSTGIDVSGTATCENIIVGTNGQITASNALYKNANYHVFRSASESEYARFNQFGDFTIGTTSTNPAGGTGVGIHLNPIGQVNTSRSGGASGVFNRTTSDGEIIQLKKDGTTVGSIGASGGNIYAGKGGSGLIFNDAGTKDLIPYSLTASDTVDNSISLGISSKRFKDIYLSGVAYATYVGSSGDTDTSIAFDTANSIRFSTAGSEAARFDSSNNLLVGTTNVNPVANNVTGTAVYPNGTLLVSREGSSAAFFNRKGSDGNIVDFRKDGTTSVGSISTLNGDLNIGTGDVGIRFHDSGDHIEPFNMSTNATRANAIDIGTSGAAFKDLYLSGNVTSSGTFRGGSGSASTPTFLTDGSTGMFRASSNDIGFSCAGSEVARFDSSGNLLVSKTSNDNSTAGVVLRDTGEGSFVASGQRSGLFSRLSSDGDIVEFRKDSTTVGSIGVQGSRPYFGNNINFSIKCDDFANGSLVPANESGVPSNNVSDIGGPSNIWNDLYLGGGVYLGGTGSANHLDGYEEGTWTPTLEGGTSAGTTTYNGRSGDYTKIGNTVRVGFYISFTAATGTGEMRLGGLPFTANADNGNNAKLGGVMTSGLNWDVDGSLILMGTIGQTYMRVGLSRDDTPIHLQNVTNETATIWGSLIYITNS